MQSVYEAQAEGPKEHRHTTKSKERYACSYYWNPVISIEPPIELVLRQIGGILRHELAVVMVGFAEDDPAHVRPEGSFAGGMRIARQVRLCVVNAVSAHPKHWASFKSKGAADRKEVLQPERALIRLVRMQAVIAQADAPADRHPVQHHCHKKRLPTKHE